VDPRTDPRERRRRDVVYAGHVLLAAIMSGWRMIEATPGLSAGTGGTFATSTAGRMLALVSVLFGAGALVAVTVLTLPRWRDPKLLLLLLLLALAVGRRTEVDVFDLLYVGVVAILAVAWFDGERQDGIALRPRGAEDGSGPFAATSPDAGSQDLASAGR
jgi:hypothetical protein